MSSGGMVVVAAAAQVPLPLPPDAGYAFDIETKVAIDASFAAFICIARSLGTPFGAVRLASDPYAGMSIIAFGLGAGAPLRRERLLHRSIYAIDVYRRWRHIQAASFRHLVPHALMTSVF